MPLYPLPHTLLIYELFDLGYEAWEIARSHKIWDTNYVKDVISKGRRNGWVRRRSSFRGRPNYKKFNRIPGEVFMPEMQRIKNPVSGEVKLLPVYRAVEYMRYGWVPATLAEFRTWHMKQGERDGLPKEVPPILPRR